MVAIKKTNQTIIGNYASNNAHILITRKADALGLEVLWNKYNSIVWEKYQIKESDFRSKTATFTTPQYLDLTLGVYAILITTPLHEDFGGVIIDIDYDSKTGLYSYQCQDWSRVYQGKIDFVSTRTVHRLLKSLITQGGIPLAGSITKAQLKQYKKVLSGLRPAKDYAQRAFGSTFEFNPMTEKTKKIIRGKSWIEAIRDLVLGTGAYIDVYFNKYGRIQIEPYHKDDFFNTGLLLTANEIIDYSLSFDTTNIITGVTVQSKNKLKTGKYYSSRDLIGIDLSAIFGNLTTVIDNPNPDTSKSSSSSSSKKKSTTKTKTSNPYNTKKKVVWLNSDNIKGKSADKKFMEDIAKILRKNGWKTKIIGVGPNFHCENYMGPKNGVWFCIYGGADAAVFREAAGKNSYTNKLKKLGSRTVIGMRSGKDIRKGGKAYKWLERAHDDNYSPASFKGLKYPLNVLTKGKVPIGYASTAEKMAAKFLKGMDNPKAC